MDVPRPDASRMGIFPIPGARHEAGRRIPWCWHLLRRTDQPLATASRPVHPKPRLRGHRGSRPERSLPLVPLWRQLDTRLANSNSFADALPDLPQRGLLLASGQFPAGRRSSSLPPSAPTTPDPHVQALRSEATRKAVGFNAADLEAADLCCARSWPQGAAKSHWGPLGATGGHTRGGLPRARNRLVAQGVPHLGAWQGPRVPR